LFQQHVSGFQPFVVFNKFERETKQSSSVCYIPVLPLPTLSASRCRLVSQALSRQNTVKTMRPLYTVQGSPLRETIPWISCEELYQIDKQNRLLSHALSCNPDRIWFSDRVVCSVDLMGKKWLLLHIICTRNRYYMYTVNAIFILLMFCFRGK